MRTWSKHFRFIIGACALLGAGASKAADAVPEKAAAQPKIAAAAPKTDNETDEKTIRATADAFVKAFNAGDAKAVAALWTEDGEYVDDIGRRFTGRDAIEKAYAELFAGSPPIKIQIAIDSLRSLGENTAIEDGRAIVEPPPVGAPGISKYTAIHVKTNGKWLMASVRDAWIEAPTAVWTAADLEWLVGNWVAEEYGVKTESTCGWAVDGRFLERRYTTTQVDGTKTSGVQLIGWNPEAGHVQSWNFSPDGGHAVGVWSPQQNGWTALIRGTTGDGIPTTAINRLTRLDDQAYVWQSVQRTVGGMALPDTNEVIWKRQPVSR